MGNMDNNQKIADVKQKVQSLAEKLINDNKYDEALPILEKYNAKLPGDPDICSMIAVAYIMQGRFDRAEQAISQGLAKDTVQFDLLYNLAYIHELKEEPEKAADLYMKADSAADSIEKRYNVKVALDRITAIDDKIEFREKTKIVFFVKDGMNNFFEDIIDRLSNEYWIRRISVSDYKQIDAGMEWADICWFEWCDELVIYASKLPIAYNKKIICRLHRYEAFTENPGKVAWENVDKLILATGQMRKLLEMNFPGIVEKVDTVIIKNGIDVEKHTFKQRTKGYKIAMMGNIYSHGNSVMLLQIMQKLVHHDKRYKLYVAGEFQEELIRLYWEYQIDRMGISENVIFDGWQDDIGNWLEDKNYFLSVSIHESFVYGIAEAMARGIKPVIHDSLYANEIWEDKFLFNTIDEAVDIILSSDYDSQKYRDFIENNYSLQKQLIDISNLLKYPLSKSKENMHFSPYTSGYIDRFDFSNAAITIGKRERINSHYESISFILKNGRDKRLVITDIIYNKPNNHVILPEYIRASKCSDKFISFCDEILSDSGVKFNSCGIAGFVYDEQLMEDIKMNGSAYFWERAIPATEFMPEPAFASVIGRYAFALNYISEGNSVLEAASGFGYGAAYLSNKAKNIKISALDIAEENIRFGKSCYDFGNIEWIQGDVTKLPFGDGAYDVYISFETMEHLPVDLIDAFFSEALRILKNGGKMILSTPNKKARTHINNPYHIKEYTFEELDNVLRRYFRKIDYYSRMPAVKQGVDETAFGYIAVCQKT